MRIKTSINIRGEVLQLTEPKVMGILNFTDDSFFTGSRVSGERDLLSKAEQMIQEGSWILDIGAMSTRPGAAEIPISIETERLVSAIKSIRQHFPEVYISADTYRAAAATAAIEAGADMINDISGAQFEPEILEVVSQFQVPYILMHTPAKPAEMQAMSQYEDVFSDVFMYFSERLNLCHQKGISDVILDPGFGFGKTLEQNWALMRKLDLFQALERPLLIGISRKSMLSKLLHVSTVDALNGTTAAHCIALMKGGNILRVHDVKEAVEAIAIVKNGY
jgi:dihydropteroate synthase